MWLIFLIAFLLGSIPFGLIIARMFKVNDLYKKGSGNIGASNVSRVVGFWPAGFATFILDVAKGVAAVWLATPVGCHLMTLVLGGSIELHSCQFDTIVIWSAGLFAILGHCYSPWLHFKGGKGVATSLGVILILSPISALFGILAFALTFIFKRVASLASIAGLGVATVTYLVFNPTGIHLCVGSAMILLILIRHEANIDALLENREKSFS
jgi:glycerol-3-phosphate acyltransferase PlsY